MKTYLTLIITLPVSVLGYLPAKANTDQLVIPRFYAESTIASQHLLLHGVGYNDPVSTMKIGMEWEESGIYGSYKWINGLSEDVRWSSEAQWTLGKKWSYEQFSYDIGFRYDDVNELGKITKWDRSVPFGAITYDLKTFKVGDWDINSTPFLRAEYWKARGSSDNGFLIQPGLLLSTKSPDKKFEFGLSVSSVADPDGIQGGASNTWLGRIDFNGKYLLNDWSKITAGVTTTHPFGNDPRDNRRDEVVGSIGIELNDLGKAWKFMTGK